jgi:hypothetical protein
MQHAGQNQQIETQTRLALYGGGYSWNSVPISDSSAEDPRFYISQPEEGLRKEALAAARRRDNALLLEPLANAEGAGKYGEAGPRSALTVPASVPPYEEGRRTYEEGKQPGPRSFRENFGSGEGKRLIEQLDRMARRMQKRKRSGDNNAKTRTAAEWEAERDRVVNSRPMAGDRSSAFDVSAVLPLESEVLQHWHRWLYTKITSQSVQRRHLDRLHEFLRRVKGGRKFGDLHWQEKEELAEICRCMVEAEERDEAAKAAA